MTPRPAPQRRPPPRLLLALVAAAGLAAPARAAPATAEEAARLTALLQTYTGAPAPGAPPSVTVTPNGEGYRATLDLNRLAAPLHDFGADVVASEPLVVDMTPLPDGTWHVTRGSFPPFGVTTREGKVYSVRFEGFATDGVFDPRLQCFSRSESSGGTTKTSLIDGATTQHSELVQTSRQVGTAAGPGAGDVAATIHQTYGNTRYAARVEAPPTARPSAARPFDIAVTMDSATGDLATQHENVAALYPLWAFLVAHPSRQQLVADQERLRELTLAMLPYAAGVAAHAEAKGFRIAAGPVKASMASFSKALAVGEGEGNGGVALSFGIGGLTIAAEGLLPDWAAVLIPETVDLHLQTSPLDLTAASRQLVRSADLATTDIVPSDAVGEAMAKLLPSQTISLDVKPSVISNKTLRVAAAGDIQGAAGLRVEADGLDRAIELLSKSEDPLADQAAQTLSLALALAKRGDGGRSAWVLQTTPNGLRVNGQLLR